MMRHMILTHRLIITLLSKRQLNVLKTYYTPFEWPMLMIFILSSLFSAFGLNVVLASIGTAIVIVHSTYKQHHCPPLWIRCTFGHLLFLLFRKMNLWIAPVWQTRRLVMTWQLSFREFYLINTMKCKTSTIIYLFSLATSSIEKSLS